MFKKVLVANRGEIAVRVMRACRELGITSVAIYSEPDITALHTRYADEAYCIGPGPVAESYLNPERVIEAAKRAGAEAIHPGYGFLSERASFAEACAEAGITFIGPPPAALRALGDKVQARRIAEQAGSPTVPGTAERVGPEEARAVAARIGYPLLIKAAAGGGGKGIRLVESEEALEPALRLAASEAAASFGDAGLYVEKYLDPVRHIEVQVLADSFGNVVHLGERECSIQRRSQKLIEETPSTAVSAELRARMGAAAVAIARTANYENAGTIEFLLDQQGDFYFIEANARLQVEHPITELLTGLDLVKEQLRVASGEPLRFTQEDIVLRGAAIECRITAEDANQNFLPSIGTVELVDEPSGPGVRVDSSLFTGAEVSPFYDSLLSKLIVWGQDRAEALQRLERALAEYRIAGVQTTLPFFQQLLRNEDFRTGRFDTRFIERVFTMHEDAGVEGQDEALSAAALFLHSRRSDATEAAATASSSGWRQTSLRNGINQGSRGGASWRDTF